MVSCDSTAVYRGFDIGTDKLPPSERGGVPHHLVDVVEATERYSAARYSQEASTAVRDITRRGRLPIVVGGSGLYYRALTRGMFPGPGRDDALRARLTRVARRRGVAGLRRALARVDPASAERIQPRDEKRLIRALEVFRLTGRPLTEHFARTRSPLADYAVSGFAIRLSPADTARRVAARVDAQFAAGLVDEVRAALAAGLPEDAHALSGLVYRQVLEHLHGARDEPATRELIVRENLRYARRQLIWFRKEPNLRWIGLPGEHHDALPAVLGSLFDLEMTQTDVEPG